MNAVWVQAQLVIPEITAGKGPADRNETDPNTLILLGILAAVVVVGIILFRRSK